MSQTTTALLCRGANVPPKLEQVAVGELRPDEALVEVQVTGVCHTDLGCMDGSLPAQFPVVFGHEGAGIVKSVGDAIEHVSPGDSVILSFASCGGCGQCKSKHPAYCHNFLTYNFGGARPDGTTALSLPSDKSKVFANFFGQSSFSRLSVVHTSSLVKVPSSTNLALFAPLGCGLQTGAGCIVNTLDVKADRSIAIFGAGSVGLSAVMTAKIRGADPIIAIDLQQSRLDLAKKLGATHTINGADKDVVEQIQKLCPPNGVNYAVECTGVPKVLETTIDSLGTRGRAASIGAPTPGVRAGVDIFSHIVLGREYVGCCEGDSVASELVPWLIQQHEEGKYPLHELIKYYDVKDFEQAIKDLKEGRTIKAVLKWV